MTAEEIEAARKKGKYGRVVYRLIEGDIKRGDKVIGKGVKASNGVIYLTGDGTWKRAEPKARMSKKQRKALRKAASV